MACPTNSVMARILWCQRQKRRASGRLDSEEWSAEEEGLRDALLNQDHSNQYRGGPPEVFMRYAIGLQDGRVLLRTGAVGLQFRSPGKTH
ncbi:MAG: hypothetical protein OEW25_09235 [Nitrospira sp.]|nr:hypothetical protein [Nitrospira sp.]MDH5253496.1 hypothetical protein [Nitrospira sp.]